jgi:hypothetical protein
MNGASMIRGYTHVSKHEVERVSGPELLQDVTELFRLGGQDLSSILATVDKDILESVILTLKYRDKNRIEPVLHRIMRRYNKHPEPQIWVGIGRMFNNLLLAPGSMKKVSSGNSAKYEYDLDLHDWLLFHIIDKHRKIDTTDP